MPGDRLWQRHCGDAESAPKLGDHGMCRAGTAGTSGSHVHITWWTQVIHLPAGAWHVRVQRPTATSFAGVNLDISFTGDILGRALSTGSSSVATGCVSCALRYQELPSRLESRGHTQPGCGTTVTARLSRKMRDGTS
ncbi:uncharacterized protein LOC144115728 isoform X2 [Amblyomma americanum]